MSTYQNLYNEDLQGNLVLRLLYNGEHSLEQKGEIILKNTESAKFVFNDKGNMLAIFRPANDSKGVRRHFIDVYQCDSEDPYDILKVIEAQKCKCSYQENDKNKQDISFVKDLIFDDDDSKVIAFGDKDFFVLNIES